MDVHDYKDICLTALYARTSMLKKFAMFVSLVVATIATVTIYQWMITVKEFKIKIKNDVFEYQDDAEYHAVRNFKRTPEQIKRQKRLGEFCKSKLPLTRVNEMLNFKHLPPSLKANLLVSHQKRIVYCAAPKVGTTNWKIMLLLFEKQIEDISEIKSKNIVHMYKQHRLFSMIGLGHINHILKKYYKFLFVRHPFVRLVSAYRNKFNDNNTYFEKMYGSRILRFTRKNLTEQQYRRGKGATFYEFIDWLIAKRVYDPHWVPIYNMCFPCILPYDYIGKLESIKEDSLQILDDIDSEHNFPVRKTDGYREDSYSLMLKYFSKISYPTIEALYNLYETDFLAFDYTVPKQFRA